MRLGRRVEVALARAGYKRLLVADLPGAMVFGLGLIAYRSYEERRGAAAFRAVFA